MTSMPATSRAAHPQQPPAQLRAWRSALTRMAWRDGAAHWGWPGALGALCLVAAAALAWVVVPAQQRELDDLTQRATTATQRALRSAARVRIADSALPPGQALAATLPDASTRQPRVAALLALAAETGVAVRSAEFKVVREPGAAQRQYTVTLPVSGPYAAVRSFIEAALRADAALSLDRLQLRRTSVAATVTDAELVWSLHMRIGPAAPPVGSAQP